PTFEIVPQQIRRRSGRTAFMHDRDQCVVASVDNPRTQLDKVQIQESTWYSVKTTRSMMRRRMAEPNSSPPQWLSNSRKTFQSCSRSLELKFKSSKLTASAFIFRRQYPCVSAFLLPLGAPRPGLHSDCSCSGTPSRDVGSIVGQVLLRSEQVLLRSEDVMKWTTRTIKLRMS